MVVKPDPHLLSLNVKKFHEEASQIFASKLLAGTLFVFQFDVAFKAILKKNCV